MTTTEQKPVKPKADKPTAKSTGKAVDVKSSIAKTKAAKPVANKALKAPKVKEPKVKKPKLVRDSFTFPKVEYVAFGQLKQRAEKLSRAVKKSELVRAGILSLTQMSDKSFLEVLTAVPTIKTGRPKKE